MIEDFQPAPTCGTCGEKRLDICSCATAEQERAFIQDQLRNGRSEAEAAEAVNKKYNELTDKVFNKFKQAHTAMRDMKDRGHFEALLNSPNGQDRLKREERFIQEKIRGMKSDIDTWDYNLGFFAKTKGDNPMVDQIKDKIAGAQKQIKQLEEKLKLIRNIAKQEQKA